LFIRSTRPLACGVFGANDVDVEGSESAAELGDAAATTARAFLVHAEDAVLVAVERHRLAVAAEVRHRRVEVVEGRFGLHEPKLHQPSGRIVHIDQHRAAVRALLEPLVVAPVNLHQLAQALPAVPRLVRA
jgi:hypothetical protein